MSRNVSDLGECLPSMLEALGSSPEHSSKHSLQVYNPTFKKWHQENPKLKYTLGHVVSLRSTYTDYLMPCQKGRRWRRRRKGRGEEERKENEKGRREMEGNREIIIFTA